LGAEYAGAEPFAPTAPHSAATDPVKAGINSALADLGGIHRPVGGQRYSLTDLFVLLFFSGFFSIPETAMMALNRHRFKHLPIKAHSAPRQRRACSPAPTNCSASSSSGVPKRIDGSSSLFVFRLARRYASAIEAVRFGIRPPPSHTCGKRCPVFIRLHIHHAKERQS